MKGRTKEATEVVRQACEYNNTDLGEFILAPLLDIPEESASCSQFVHPDHRSITIPLWVVWGCFGFVYYGVILFVSRIFTDHGEDDDDPENVFRIAKNLIKNALQAKGIDLTEMKIRGEESIQVVLIINAFIPANYVPSGKNSPTFIDLS